MSYTQLQVRTLATTLRQDPVSLTSTTAAQNSLQPAERSMYATSGALWSSVGLKAC